MMETVDQCQERWMNRRRMAWYSFDIAVMETLILILVLMFGNPAAIGDADPLIYASYGLWAAIIGAYIGFSTWDDVRAGKGRRKDKSSDKEES